MRLAAFQFDVRRGDVAHNLAEVERGLTEAARRGIELVVLPEMWPTSFVAEGEAEDWLRATEAALERVQEFSRTLGLVVAGSAFGRGRPGELPRNRLTLFARGERLLEYDKLHLFSPTAEGEGFSAGEAPPATVDTSLGRVAGLVCYDLRFALALRAPFLAGAEILVVPAQWPAARASAWCALVCGRAAELQACVIGCNRTGEDDIGRRRLRLSFPGNSLIAGPDGSVLAAGEGAAGLVEASFELGSARELRRSVPVRRDERRDLGRI
ncbi:MAG TPA: nitrilase-related carbon-nitrogen hydrolase [Planctomycetota bacterium]